MKPFKTRVDTETRGLATGVQVGTIETALRDKVKLTNISDHGNRDAKFEMSRHCFCGYLKTEGV